MSSITIPAGLPSARLYFMPRMRPMMRRMNLSSTTMCRNVPGTVDLDLVSRLPNTVQRPFVSDNSHSFGEFTPAGADGCCAAVLLAWVHVTRCLGFGQLAYNKRMRILTASQASDVAFEDPRLGHGLLTYALCHDGLKHSKADYKPSDGRIYISEWLSYAVQRVPQLTADIAAGKIRAHSAEGRNLTRDVPLFGRETIRDRTIAQQPSLFDSTRRPDSIVLIE
jgi:hypothetical protein